MLYRSLLLSLFFTFPAVGEPRFIPPDDTRPLLQREFLPIDIASMHRIAKQLTSMASTPMAPNDSGADLLRKTRSLTLAQRLHPSFPRAQRLMQQLASEKFKGLESQPSRQKEIAALARTAQRLLEAPDHKEGYRLGQLILDVLPPKHPLAKQRDRDREETRWRRVVAGLAAFENKSLEKSETPLEEETSYRTSALETLFPILGEKTAQAIPRFTLTLTEPGRDFRLLPEVQGRQLEKTNAFLRRFFDKRGTPLPSTRSLQLETSTPILRGNHRANIFAPTALMLEAALSGQELRSDVILLAQLKKNGILARPNQSWALLKHLADAKASPGTRIIVPPIMETELTGFLTLERPDFFLSYEVITATTFDEAQSLFYLDQKIASPLAESISTFAEIVEKAPNSRIPTFLSYKGVQSRLTKASAAPQHLSAKLLHLQASGKRPAVLSRPVLAMELHLILAKALKIKPEKTTSRDLKILFSSLRQDTEALAKIIDISDRPLVQDVLTLIKELPGLARELEKEEALYEGPPALTAFKNKVKLKRANLSKNFSNSSEER